MAAIERTAQQYDFGSAPQVGAVPINVQNAQPDVNKFANNDVPQAPHNEFLDNLTQALLPAVSKLAQNELTTNREEAYLRGAAAAGAGKAQSEVDSNIFTRDWSTAGYSDTRARLAMADAEAQTSVDMTKMREQSPEDFKQYLETRRQKLLPMLQGMSLDARKSFLAQQLTSDRAAITKHAGEHQKFVIDQLGTAIQTDMSVRLDAMDKSKTDPAAYLAAADDAYSGLYGNVWNNPNLTKDVKQKLTEQGAQLALAKNHLTLYEHMRDQKVPGMNSTMLEQLPFDSQVKLAKSYEQSRKDTEAFRLSNLMEQRGLMEATFNDPTKPPMAWEDFKAFKDQLLQNGALSTADNVSLTKAWAEANEKKLANGNLARDYAAGNQQGIFAAGKDEGQAYTAYIQTAARNGKSIAETTAGLLQIGLTTGQQSAFKGVGELTKSSVMAIGQSENIDPSQLQMLNTVLGTLDAAEQKGNKTAMSAYLSSFDDASRAKIMTYREQLQRTGNPTIAANAAAEQIAATAGLTKEQKDVMAANHAKADLKAVADIEPRGLWGTLKSMLPDVVRSQTALNTDKITAGQSWFENPERVQAELAKSKAAMLEELTYISRENPYASDDARQRLALAKVADRTLVLKDGPLVLPRLPSGTTIQDFFGVNRNVRPETIADVISELHPAGKGNRVAYTVNGNAQLQWQEFGPKGELVNAGGTLDPKFIAGAVQDKQDSISEQFMKTDGEGITVKGTTGVPVTFNGNNTAGVPNQVVLDIRKDLVKFEDVRDRAYDDASGKVVDGKRVQTVGVGVSTTNTHFPKADPNTGIVPPQAINDSFVKASNDALVSAAKYARETGKHDLNALKLFTQLTYQGGSVPSSVVKAVKAGDREEAMKALFDSPQYKMAHEARRVYYTDLMRGIMPVTH